MVSPSEAAGSVVALAAAREPTLGAGRLVAVDGPAGSGKTTLAAALSERTGATVVHVDDLLEGWEGMAGTGPRLEALLRPLARGESGCYERYDWLAERFADQVEVAPSPWLVVEGVGAGNPALGHLVTVLVWVEVDAALRLRRGLERDGSELAPQWRRWMTDEAGLFATHGTRDRADLRVAVTSIRGMTVAPSGEQHEISGGGYAAVVTESGGALRQLTLDGRPVVDGFAEDAMSSGGQGQLLMPWPNRIRDGQYEFDGRSLQLPLSEPSRHNASHGLARWAAWSVAERTDSSVRLVYRLVAQTGYPWTLDLSVAYSLGDDGLTVTQGAVNRATGPAPYAQGAHPYLSTGREPVDGWLLEVPAATRLLTDPERKLPTGRQALAGTDHDFRTARPIGTTVVDHAFTDLDRDDAGRVTVRLRDPGSGAGAEVWADDRHDWVMVYTADENAGDTHRRAVAVEPMTAPPDAFRSGDSLVVLAPAGEPGDAFSASWGIRALR